MKQVYHPPRVFAVHSAVPGRARLRIAGLYHSEELKRVLEMSLAETNGVQKISANIQTGNALVYFDPRESIEELVSNIESALQSEGFERSIDSARRQQAAAPRTANSYPGVRELWDAAGRAVRGFGRRGSMLPEPDEGEANASAAMHSWHTLSAPDVGSFWETSPSRGLDPDVARQRLQQFGPNLMPMHAGRSPLAIFIEQLKSLPVILLAGSAVLSIATGGMAEAVVIAAVVAVNASIGYSMERQAGRTLNALLESAEPAATIIRGGAVIDVPAEDLAPGDLLVLTPGSEVGADARLVESDWLTLDESALTGESMPVEKTVEALDFHPIPLAERKNMVYRGTVVTGGSGLAIVVSTGRYTEIGRIQALMSESIQPETPLQRQMRELGGQMVWFTGVICGGLFLVGVLRGFSALQMIRSAISLAVAAVPEGLPAVATTALASGARSMLRHNLLLRRLEAIEALGSAQVVCLDKTGTLTLNRMSVTRVFVADRSYQVSSGRFLDERRPVVPSDHPALSRLIEICALCNEAEIDTENGSGGFKGSPTEAALLDLAMQADVDIQDLRSRFPRQEIERRAEDRNYMRTTHYAGGKRRLLAVKGSPAEVLALCDRVLTETGPVRMNRRYRKASEEENEEMAGSALRVLGVAYREYREDDASNGKPKLIWLGLVGMADPTREGLAEVIRDLRLAGIRPVMITGDQSSTAQAVGQALNLNGNGQHKVLDATQAESLSPGELRTAVSEVDIFARVNPTHKLRLVQAFQQAGNVVAMTGDGINDGPALKAADIGITLGKSGARVAREVADVVLKDDNIRTLLAGIREGRRIQDNIRKAIHYIAATNGSEVLVMFGGLAAGLGQPLTPRQLLWINLISDIFPELALVLAPAEADTLRRPPRAAQARLLDRAALARVGTGASVIGVLSLAAYGYGAARYGIGERASTLAFISLTSAQLLHAISANSETHSIFHREGVGRNRYLTMSMAAGFGILLLAALVPGIRRLLGIVALSPADWLIGGSAAAASLFVNEGIKVARRRREPLLLPAPEGAH